MKPKLKPPGFKRLKLEHEKLLSNLAFNANLCRYILVWGQKSSGAAPFGTLCALTLLWFGISVPLVFVGSYFGYKKAAPEQPVRTNKIPRQVPPQPW
jgi:transmembrane 9 superfamily protein 2/4